MGILYFLVYLFLEILFSYEFARIFTPFGLFLEVIFSTIVGFSIFRNLQFSMALDMQRVLKREVSEEEFMTMGLFRMIGAVFLIIPGVLTDILGILFLFEPFARMVAKKIFPPKPKYDIYDDIIDVEIIEERKN
jgi:UPF0716 family protein affecting phage T7 exclusion